MGLCEWTRSASRSKPGLGDAVRQAARRDDKGLSARLAEAARAKLRAEALEAFLDAWEREHGPLTVEELRRAEAELGLVAARLITSSRLLPRITGTNQYDDAYKHLRI